MSWSNRSGCVRWAIADAMLAGACLLQTFHFGWDGRYGWACVGLAGAVVFWVLCLNSTVNLDDPR